MLDEMGHAKVCDFGLAKPFTVGVELNTLEGTVPEGKAQHSPSCAIGTLRYMAPEVLKQREHDVEVHYNEAADVFSFGVLLWELAARETYFAGFSGQQVALEMAPAGRRPPLRLPAGLEPLNELIKECWHQEPARRPSMSACAERLLRLVRSAGPAGERAGEQEAVQLSKSTTTTNTASSSS